MPYFHKLLLKIFVCLFILNFSAIGNAAKVKTMSKLPELPPREYIFAENLLKGQGQVHASTLEATENGTILCAAYYGSKEGHPDVEIIVSRRTEDGWSTPETVTQAGKAHWNPVLFEVKPGDSLLMYKVGRAPVHWVTMVRESLDDGKTWLPERPLVANDTRQGRGPVKNKPIRLTNGRILAPASTELNEWEAFVDISDDNGVTWHKSNIIHAADLLGRNNYAIGVIQPSLWQDGLGAVHMLLRSTEGHIYKSDSKDNGSTWCAAYPLDIPNNNSGLDLVRSPKGILYLVCNPVTQSAFGKSRSPLTLFFSRDNGNTWTKMVDLETGKGEYSYPAIIERDGDVYISYTWQRRNIAFRHFTQVELAKYRIATNKTY